MSVTARSKSEADAHIEQRRKALGIVHGEQYEESELVANLNNSLVVISSQLYKNLSHFLLEIIQNADDNKYATDVTPSLTLSLYSRSSSQYFRSDCNEIGFSYDNLIAITRVGQSTKAGADRGQRGLIGEKGIGFKSVFKVADKVHVASGHYEFMFDGNGPLGMILPTHYDFPRADRRKNYTQFLLHLRSADDFDQIETDLNDMKPQILLFLRSLRRLRISTNNGEVTHVIQNEGGDTELLSETKALFTTDDENRRTNETKYIMVRHNAIDMPQDMRREGVTVSEVVLAFPIQNSSIPVTGQQQVFAFLPIDDFGFNFLIHADFILVAAREDLEYSSTWNVALRDAIRDAFSKAMCHFATIPANSPDRSLRYMWPKYIRHHRSSQNFWNWLHEDMIQVLRTKRILQSCSLHEKYYRAGELRYVPHKFRYEGVALFDCLSTRAKHLSFDYDKVHEGLRLLGIRDLTLEELCREFSDWIEQQGEGGLNSKPEDWHRQVAKLFCDRASLKDTLSGLPIIPLVNGTWVNAKAPRLYLSTETGNEHVPNGISIQLINEIASRDTTRRRFFQFLGIPTYTPSQVCQLIGELHSKNPLRIKSRDIEDLIADAAYLFKYRTLLSTERNPKLFFQVKKGESLSCRNDQIYIVPIGSTSSIVAKHRSNPRSPFYILHEEYERRICGGASNTKEVFYRWLLDSQDVAQSPILVRGGFLTPEWTYLRDTSIKDLLSALKDQWRLNSLHDRLQSDVPQLQVNCSNGERRTLAEVAVPTTELVRACPHIVFADIPDPDSWGFLAEFNITTAPTLATWLSELEALSNLSPDSVNTEQVRNCYLGLGQVGDLDTARIINAFNSRPLVFLTRPNHKWVSHKACVWNAPPALKHVTKLSSRYSDCRRLFFDHLGVRSANVKQAVEELCCLPNECAPDNCIPRLEELLTVLQGYMRDEFRFTTSQFMRLMFARIFPVTKAGGTHNGALPRTVYRALKDPDWYIPDRLTLESAFRGRIDLLNLPVRAVASYNYFFLSLKCHTLYLSHVVTEVVEPQGLKVRDMAKEGELNARLKYISCLQTPTASMLGQSRNMIQAWSVPSVVIKRRLEKHKREINSPRTVPQDGNLIHAPEENELVTVIEDKESINVYFREAIPESKHPQIFFKLAEFFSRMFSLRAEDKSFVSVLLSAPKEDLAGIMAENNRFLPDELLSTPVASSEEAKDKGSAVLTASTSIPLNVEDQYTVRELVPSFHLRVESIARLARQFRVSKALVVGGAASAREKSRRNQQSDSFPLTMPMPTQAIPFVLAHDNSADSPTRDVNSPSLLPTSKAISNVERIKTRAIGALGEKFVFTLLEAHLSDWTYENWTSKLRVDSDHPPFVEKEKDYADFTYIDRSCQLKTYLQGAGVEPSEEWSNRTTYHLEVKSTTCDDNEPFHVSQNQLMMMRAYDNDPQNVYILLRIFNVDGENPGMKLYPRPWRLWMEGVLLFTAQNGYSVTELSSRS